MGKDRHKANKAKNAKAKRGKDPSPFVSRGSRGGSFFSPTHEMLVNMNGGLSTPLLATAGPSARSLPQQLQQQEPQQKLKNIRKNKNRNLDHQPVVSTAASQSALLHQALLSTSSPHLRSLTRFKKSHSILLVGEGDFSFTSALCRALDITPQSLPSKSDGRIIATSYDTLSDISSKYTTDAVDRIRLLQRLPNVSVIHKLDATQMSKDGRLVSTQEDGASTFKPIHRIVFNFPHVGGGMDKDVKVNRRMLLAFFNEAHTLLSLSLKNSGGNNNTSKAGSGGGSVPKKHNTSNDEHASPAAAASKSLEFQVLVALRKTPFYEKFGLQELAEASGFVLTEQAKFDGDRWSALGYKPQRTNPAQREAPGWENAELFVFSLADETGRRNLKGDQDKKQAVDALMASLESDEEEEVEEEETNDGEGKKRGRRGRGKEPVPPPKKGSRAARVQEKFKKRQEKKDLKKQKLGKVKGGKISKKGGGGWESL
ncbi:hypothetical protein BDR26DRAFT_869196 [Obelidium mucronatum]|nr:hypothetical protein BDR26DRAFT_869196 [Obelidium mucronatum]